MTQGELLDEMARRTNLSRNSCKAALSSFMDIVLDALLANDDVRLMNFGTFTMRSRKERKGRNPRSPEEVIMIPPSAVPAFKPSKNFKLKFKT